MAKCRKMNLVIKMIIRLRLIRRENKVYSIHVGGAFNVFPDPHGMLSIKTISTNLFHFDFDCCRGRTLMYGRGRFVG